MRYDPAGNLLSDGTTTLTYDALGRVTSLSSAGQSSTQQYNGDGTLVAQTQGGITTRYTQDLAAPMSQILSDGSRRYVYGNPAERLYGQTASSRTWYSTDALGSVRATLNDTGTPLATANYDAWGRPETPAIAPFGFTGELQQGDQVWLRARWYDALRGSFSSRDPFAGQVERPYSLLPYQYAYSSPGMWTDPTGECVGWIWGDPSCSFIGVENIRKGNFNWEDGRVWESAALDFLPVIGDIKGVIEAFTGCDLITGEDLGPWRWMGLMGLSELRHLKHLDEVVDVAKNTKKLGNKIGREWWESAGAKILDDEKVLQQADDFVCVATCARIIGLPDEVIHELSTLAHTNEAKGVTLKQMSAVLTSHGIAHEMSKSYTSADVMPLIEKELSDGKHIIIGVTEHAVVVESVKKIGSGPRDWLVTVSDPATGHRIELEKAAWSWVTGGDNEFISIP